MFRRTWGLNQSFEQRDAIVKSSLVEIEVGQRHLIWKDVASRLDTSYELFSRDGGALNSSEKSDDIKLGSGVLRVRSYDGSQLFFSVLKSPLSHIDSYKLITRGDVLGFLIN